MRHPVAVRVGSFLLVTAAVGLAVGAGCTGSEGPPDAFENRERLPRCGEVDVRDGLDEAERQAAECFQEAWSEGERSEVIVTQSGTEGGVVRSYLRVRAHASGEQWVNDTTGDVSPWSLSIGCTQLTPGAQGGLTFSGCRQSDTR